MAIVFDIETGPNPDVPVPTPPDFDREGVTEKMASKYKKDETILKHVDDAYEDHIASLRTWNDDARKDWPLRPAYGRIVGASFVNSAPDAGTVDIMMLGVNDVTEVDIINRCFAAYKWCSSRGCKLIGFNNKHFDLPFIVLRALANGIAIPTGFVKLEGKWMNWSIVHFDLSDLVLLGRHPGMCKWSFDETAQLFGTDAKPKDVTGDMIWKLIEDGRVNEAHEYMANDVLGPLAWARHFAKLGGGMLLNDPDLKLESEAVA